MAVFDSSAPKFTAYSLLLVARRSTKHLCVYLSLIFPLRALAQTAEVHPVWPVAHVQFFGDVFIDHKFQQQAALAPDNPLGVSDDLQSLIHSALYNIANFEGVATSQQMKFGDKTFHLQMPVTAPRQLARLGINAVTLGNNHSMDFGLFGLFESLARLNHFGIATFGAGLNATEALKPFLVRLPEQNLCVFSFAKTYPASTWATKHFAGVANPSSSLIMRLIQGCRQEGSFSIIVFHWGRELEKSPQDYQRELAHSCIDAGAIAVIGHHPHILQDIEVYKGVPIFYSLGNFLFSSAPVKSSQEGMAVRMTLKKDASPTFDLVQMQVNNRVVNFHTRLLQGDEASTLDQMLQSHGEFCQKKQAPGSWACRFSK